MASTNEMDAFDRNTEISEYLTVWMWCSRSLHVKWERSAKYRNSCLIALAMAVNEDRAGKKIQVPELADVYQRLPVPMFQEEGLRSFWRAAPACLLDLALGRFTGGSPLADKLNRLRKRHETNRKLDQLFKKMTSREKRYGQEWITEGRHPQEEFDELELRMAFLWEALEHAIVSELKPMDKLARRLLADGGWQKPQIPLSWTLRKTPESLLNRACRLKLWQVAQAVSFRNLDENAELEALCEAFYAGITPSARAAIEAQGYTVDAVIDDFLNFDRHKSREQIIGGATC